MNQLFGYKSISEKAGYPINMKQMINSILDRFQLGAFARNALDFLKYIFNWKLLLKNARFIRNGAPDGLPVQTPGLAFLVCGQYDLESMYHNGRNGELVVRGKKYSGTNICGTYHPRYYLEKLAEGRLIEIDYSAQGATDADQDVYLFRTVKLD